MSVEAMSRALNIRGLPPAEKLALIGIANHHGDGGSWPSMETLARYVGVTSRQVRRLVVALEERGLITVHFQAGGTAQTRDDRRPNRYDLHTRGVEVAPGRGVTPTSPRPENGVTPSAPRGDTQRVHGVTPMSPEPSLNRPKNRPVNSGSQSSTVAHPADERVEAFEEFWATYPRRVARRAAEDAWIKACKRAPFADILAGLRARIAWWDRARTDRTLVPHPATWLNQDRWADEIEPTPQAAAASIAQGNADAEARQRDEAERAVAEGNPDLAWRMIKDRARSQVDKVLFAEIADRVDQGLDPEMILLSVKDATQELVDEVLAAKATVFARDRAQIELTLPGLPSGS